MIKYYAVSSSNDALANARNAAIATLYFGLFVGVLTGAAAFWSATCYHEPHMT